MNLHWCTRYLENFLGFFFIYLSLFDFFCGLYLNLKLLIKLIITTLSLNLILLYLFLYSLSLLLFCSKKYDLSLCLIILNFLCWNFNWFLLLFFISWLNSLIFRLQARLYSLAFINFNNFCLYRFDFLTLLS